MFEFKPMTANKDCCQILEMNATVETAIIEKKISLQKAKLKQNQDKH